MTISCGTFDAFITLFEIDKCLRNKDSQKFTDIQKHLEFVLHRPISKRSLQWYFQQMRHNTRLKFYAPIKYCRFKNTYSYTDKDYSIVKTLAATNKMEEVIDLLILAVEKPFADDKLNLAKFVGIASLAKKYKSNE